MAKYDPIARFLRRRRTLDEVLSFAEIERMIGGLLPKRARVASWWSGAAEGAAPASAWRGAGYEAELIAPETVRFQRQPPRSGTPIDGGASGG